MKSDIDKFLEARDFLHQARSQEEAQRTFRWPELTNFNWALDYFDRMAEGNTRTALMWVDEDGTEIRRSFHEMAHRSNRVANFFQANGFAKSDTVLVLVSNIAELHEILLAALKTSVVVIPASTLLTPEDIADRIRRGGVRHIITEEAYVSRVDAANLPANTLATRIVVGAARPGWIPFTHSETHADTFQPSCPTHATDPALLYFTSGTTAAPKMVLHSHTSYPVGHLVTMYWIGLRPGDVHLNISAPGWGKHSWSSFFAPWNAEATVVVPHYHRFHAARMLDHIEHLNVTTLCAPPSVWRRFLAENLAQRRFSLREIVSAGEPLTPEIYRRVQAATGIRIREGYGQTETVLQIGTFRDMPVREGAMGCAAPGFTVAIVGPTLQPLPPNTEGQIALRVQPERPLGLMKGYPGDRARESDIFRDGWYLTGDIARMDDDGYFWFIGRNDDIFKSSDYRISPFEIESELLAHPAVAEAAVIGSLDAARNGLVPKVFVSLHPGFEACRETALDVFRFARHRLAPYKRPRRLEFMNEMMKTISGKIRRAELRSYDDALRRAESRGHLEHMESDFPDELGPTHNQ